MKKPPHTDGAEDGAGPAAGPRAYHRFGNALHRALESWGYDPHDPEDAALFLEHLRAVRQPARPFAYAPCILQAWLNGRLLPDPATLQACVALSRNGDDPALESMLDAWDAASGHQLAARRACIKRIAAALGTNVTGQGHAPSLMQRMQEENPNFTTAALRSSLLSCTPLSPEMYRAIQQILDRDLAPETAVYQSAQAALDQARMIAGAEGHNRDLTEFGALLNDCIVRAGLTQHAVADQLYAASERVGSGPGISGAHANANHPLTHATVSAWCRGRTLPSPIAVRVMQRILMAHPAVAKDARLLSAVYDAQLESKAQATWQKGLDENQPGLLLLACRERFGESVYTFSEGYCSHAAWNGYESTKHSGKGFPRRIAVRQELMEHTLYAVARAGEQYATALGIAPRPWILRGETQGLPAGTAWPIAPSDAQLARERMAILQREAIDNPALDSKKYELAASVSRHSGHSRR